MSLQIITNNQTRDLVALADLPESVQSDFDYITDDAIYDNRMFCYRGAWYDIGDMMQICGDHPSEFSNWHGYESETFFSGILVKLNPIDDTVIVGRYFS